MSGTVDQSAQIVMERLEELNSAAPIFWGLSLEGYTAIVEALCEATLLVGRPTQIVNVPYSITPNQWWQPIPTSILAITDIQGPGSQIWKWTLRDMDYVQAGSGSDWQNDITSGQTFSRWFSLGFTMFGIWPSVPHAQTVTLTGIANPVASTWPYNGSQTINIHDEFFQAIEKYAAHYCRLKESGDEFKASMELYQGFMDDMQRMTAIENRRDPYIFTRGVGAAADLGQLPDQR